MERFFRICGHCARPGTALIGILADIYEGDATFSYDTPVPAGTTDNSQFILGAQDAADACVAAADGPRHR